MIPIRIHDDQSNEPHQEAQETESAQAIFADELIDQLLAQVQNKDAESILGESGLPASSRSSWPSAC